MEDNILSSADMTLKGLEGLFKAVRAIPNDPKLSDADRAQITEALSKTDLNKAESELKDAIIRLRNLAKPQ